jgi:hypothetical protein
MEVVRFSSFQVIRLAAFGRVVVSMPALSFKPTANLKTSLPEELENLIT